MYTTQETKILSKKVFNSSGTVSRPAPKTLLDKIIDLFENL